MMQTDLKGLLDAGLALSGALWDEAAQEFDWAAGMDRYVIHQVSVVHTQALCDKLGIDPERVPPTFPDRGNIGPVSVPFTLASQADSLDAGRPGAADGHRLRAQRRLSRDRVVTARTSPTGWTCPGLDPSWSRVVTVPDAAGVRSTWHVLDNGVADPVGTLVCVHGNPTWSYLWRGLLAAAPAGWRVVAADHLGMGWSERLDAPRTLAQRVADLGTLTAALGVTGPVVTVGHDWGGAISLGWALAHRSQLRGVVLTNTAVAQPPDDKGPALIRLAHVPLLRGFSCVRTPTFVRATSALSRPALPREVRARSRRRTPRPGGAGPSATSWPTSRSGRTTRPTAAATPSRRGSATSTSRC